MNDPCPHCKRVYKISLSELIDRLSIVQLKEVKIPEHRAEYAKEIQEIMNDIDIVLKEESLVLDSSAIRAIVVLAQYNNHIWVNEANFRNGIKEGNCLELSHSLNGIRNRAKNFIQSLIGGRKDYKVDCLAADHSSWEPSWNGK